MPRWTFEKFPEADETLTTQMKSVGEGMAIGRTFKEALQKAIRRMEVKRFGLGLDANDRWLQPRGDEALADRRGLLVRKLSVPSQGRLYYVRYAVQLGWPLERIHELTGIDPWFLDQLMQLIDFEDGWSRTSDSRICRPTTCFEAKRLGYSDPQLANLYLGGSTESILEVRVTASPAESSRSTSWSTPVPRSSKRSRPTSTRPTSGFRWSRRRGPNGRDDESGRRRPKIVILGGGPNRIGQGIEFDYCCCQARFAAAEMGFESVMINSNPETVSTDYDTSDQLFFEPLTLEDVLNIVERLNGGGVDIEDRSGGVVGCVVQYGGQTPLNLAHGLVAAGVPIIGTGLDSIDLAEDRDRFKMVLDELGLQQPENGIAHSLDEAVEIASRIGYPVLVRPSYVLGGRGMETCYDETVAAAIHGRGGRRERPAGRAGVDRPFPRRRGGGRCRRRGRLRAARRVEGEHDLVLGGPADGPRLRRDGAHRGGGGALR